MHDNLIYIRLNKSRRKEMAILNIKALMALSAADVANELWRWESPLMGGADEAMATYPAIDWVNELSSDELSFVAKGLESLGAVMSQNSIADHTASDDAVLSILKRVNPDKAESLVQAQIQAWNKAAIAAVAATNSAVVCGDEIEGYLKIEIFRGADGGDAIASAIAKFGEAAIVQHAVAQITTTKQWWDFADYLKGDAYKMADDAYNAAIAK